MTLINFMKYYAIVDNLDDPPPRVSKLRWRAMKLWYDKRDQLNEPPIFQYKTNFVKRKKA